MIDKLYGRMHTLGYGELGFVLVDCIGKESGGRNIIVTASKSTAVAASNITETL